MIQTVIRYGQEGVREWMTIINVVLLASLVGYPELELLQLYLINYS